MALLDLGTDLEQLVWEDIQSDGLGDSAAPGCSEPAGKSGVIESRPPPGQQSSSPLSSATDLAVSSARLHSAAGDAGSASMAGPVGAAAGEGGAEGQEDVGPFAAALQGCHQRLDSRATAPLGGRRAFSCIMYGSLKCFFCGIAITTLVLIYFCLSPSFARWELATTLCAHARVINKPYAQAYFMGTDTCICWYFMLLCEIGEA